MLLYKSLGAKRCLTTLEVRVPLRILFCDWYCVRLWAKELGVASLHPWQIAIYEQWASIIKKTRHVTLVVFAHLLSLFLPFSISRSPFSFLSVNRPGFLLIISQNRKLLHWNCLRFQSENTPYFTPMLTLFIFSHRFYSFLFRIFVKLEWPDQVSWTSWNSLLYWHNTILPDIISMFLIHVQ